MAGRTDIQRGVRCRRCGEDIYSNSPDDFVECRCGATTIEGGFDYLKVTYRPDIGSPAIVERPVPASVRLPLRFRDIPIT